MAQNLTGLPDGPSAAERRGPKIPDVPAGKPVSRPPRNPDAPADPGPAARQGRVDVPHRPGEGR